MREAQLAIFQMRLDGIAQTMQETLFRCAVSPVVREGNDAASALVAPCGEIMALSDAIPLLLGALQSSVGAILETFPPEEMRPGDLFVMNDPYSGGTHLPDLTVAMPVFLDGEQLLGLAATIMHHQDIGGMRAGSVPPDAVDIFQEGLRLPPMRLGADGAIDPAMRRLFAANSRVPATVLGDLGAQIAAGNRAASDLERLAAGMGRQEFQRRADSCRDMAEKQLRDVIATFAPDTYRGQDGLDPHPDLPPIGIEVALRVADGGLNFDFSGTTGQVRAPINCVRSGPLAAVFYALLSLGGPDLLRNGGVMRPVTIELPPASIINAAPPAAVNARMGVVRVTTSAVLQALAKAAPDRMPAANSGMSFVIAFSGRTEAGEQFLLTEIVAGGAGGGPDRDGAPGISTDVGNAMNMPAEGLEAMIPVGLISYEIRLGSGGPGRHRGGDGVRRVYQALADAVAVSIRGDRFLRVPKGLKGGGAPKPASATIERADGQVEKLPSRASVTLNAGDRLILESSGGAGYGPSS